jgi:cell division septum initiation protein DivIVA
MESRIECIKIQFKKEHSLFLDSFSKKMESPKEAKAVAKAEAKAEAKAVAEAEVQVESISENDKKKSNMVTENAQKPSKTPLALTKIMKHRKDLDKNNLKRAQKIVECSGSIEEYERALGLQPN